MYRLQKVLKLNHDDDDEEEEEDDGEFDQASVNSATNVHVEESPSYCYKWNPEKSLISINIIAIV